MAMHILIADPTRPAYRDVARECLAAEGWELLMPDGPSDDQLTALLLRADVIITRRRIVDPTLL